MLTPPRTGDPATPPDPTAMPRDSSPTAELEMLISGGVVFSLFQLPGVIDGAFRHWEPHATQAASFVLLMLYAYVKGALYLLIGAFVLHLGVRAYWVGLVGLDSVFPAGVRWDRTQLGPIAQEMYRDRMPTLPRLIARLDNFASIIFSFAFLVVLVAFMSMPILLVVGGIAYPISRVAGGELRLVSLVMVLLFAMPPMVVAALDKSRGGTIPPDSRLGRLLRRLTGIYYRTQLIGLLGPVLFTISTNARRRTTYAIFYAALLGSLYLAIGEWVASRGVFTINGKDYFSTGSEQNAVDFAHYESQWGDGVMNGAAPSIQSDIVREPFVRLFIPYQTDRHNAGVAARCPAVQKLEPTGLRLARSRRSGAADDSLALLALHCLAGLHAVTLDGAPVADIRFRFATHARTGVDGIIAYLPTSALSRGEHVLTVTPPPRRPGSRNRRPLEPYVIPFWL